MNPFVNLFHPTSFRSKSRIQFWVFVVLFHVCLGALALSLVLLESRIGETGVMILWLTGGVALLITAWVWTWREKCPKCGWPVHTSKTFAGRLDFDHCSGCGVDFRALPP
jgi:hypothetical protein